MRRLLLSHSLQSCTTNIQRIFREGLNSTGESGAEQEEKEGKAMEAPAEPIHAGLEAQGPSPVENSPPQSCAALQDPWGAQGDWERAQSFGAATAPPW